ncbi:Hint domain-containing protein [Roseicyclus mahoneyensis]|uniref:Hint domain-containing protein n=1 Tax=Roseicyclus mahoneyensis TaxID=164332 RepID=A0A316GKD2_9RHOB|nr:Hint domain-containing protein [Roseicyclus mahoneyensis]PWK61096.1 Hint domain-containing protein [Roseicyclus mahoneyensis]
MSDLAPLCRFSTYPADAIRALTGANEGDPIGLGDAALPGDTYRLHREAVPARLAICDRPGGGQAVAEGSEVGLPGEALTIADCHRFMGAKGDMIEVLVLKRQSETEGTVLHLLPLSPLQPGTEYDLIGSSRASAPERFADIASVSFFAGTHLTLAGGGQRKVEDLRVGDLVLTRDHGPRPVRWIGPQTRRATGASAPIRIAQGTLNAARDVRLSPQHRLFIWQRRDRLGTGRAEVLVRADLLVNGTTVTREEGGHVDSYQILFDSHEIIFAEGIAVESLLVTAEIRARLPQGLTLDAITEGQREATRLEVDETVLGDAAGAAARLTHASRGTGSDED